MSKTKEKPKQKRKKECERILEFLFNGQNPMEIIKFYQDEEELNSKKWRFFAQ